MKKNNLNRSQLADKLGVTKGYISQILNGEFNHRIATFVDLSLAIGKVPKVEFEDLEEMIYTEKEGYEVRKWKIIAKRSPETSIVDTPCKTNLDDKVIIRSHWCLAANDI